MNLKFACSRGCGDADDGELTIRRTYRHETRPERRLVLSDAETTEKISRKLPFKFSTVII